MISLSKFERVQRIAAVNSPNPLNIYFLFCYFLLVFVFVFSFKILKKENNDITNKKMKKKYFSFAKNPVFILKLWEIICVYIITTLYLMLNYFCFIEILLLF